MKLSSFKDFFNKKKISTTDNKVKDTKKVNIKDQLLLFDIIIVLDGRNADNKVARFYGSTTEVVDKLLKARNSGQTVRKFNDSNIHLLNKSLGHNFEVKKLDIDKRILIPKDLTQLFKQGFLIQGNVTPINNILVVWPDWYINTLKESYK